MTYRYWFMFRVADVGDDTERRQSIYDAMLAPKPKPSYWFEPTSSGFIESELISALFVRSVTRKLVGSIDLFLVGDINNPGNAAYFGNVQLPNVLKHFLPLAVKVT